jgi:hypothetical protein
MPAINTFSSFRLTADLSGLSENEKQMIPLLIEAAKIMDDIFWMEAWGNKDLILSTVKDEEEKKHVMINYGPWERLSNNRPFIEKTGPKPKGACFYPADMTVEEFENFDAPDKKSLYTIIKRDDNGNLKAIPYHQAFKVQVMKAADFIKQAAILAEDPGLQKYLKLRAEALLTDNYYESDRAWMEMKNNTVDFIVGPVETYEDQLFGYKAAHEAFILIKDRQWSRQLSHYTRLLLKLQKSLPADERYLREVPGGESDLGAYDVIYYAGDCNAGSKTIAINLPNDERVQLEIGSRRLQLKNSMQAKFERILLPIAKELIRDDQIRHITFDAFFSHTMFHEIAHGLGTIKNTIGGKGTVRNMLKDKYTTLEESKADIIGLYLVAQLKDMGELDSDLTDEYTTFFASIFRSIRFGASSAHGKANLIFYNYFKENDAFLQTTDGRYCIIPGNMKEAVRSLANIIITIQGDGDYEKAAELINRYAVMDDPLQHALKKIEDTRIPVDIIFEQGTGILGIK